MLSSWHGVIIVVMGNCGVGFVLVVLDKYDWLIGLMEGVEDILELVLVVGICWGWESFLEYLDVVEVELKVIDVVVQVFYGVVRVYVLWDCGGHVDLNWEDIDAMVVIVCEGLEVGVLGFSCAHTLILKSIEGEYIFGALVDIDELIRVVELLWEFDCGVYQVFFVGVAGEDPEGWECDLVWLCEVVLCMGCFLVFMFL